MNQKQKAAIIAICEINEKLPKTEINRTWHIGQYEIRFHWRSKHSLWGRFGGGWNWELGFQIGGSTLILNLLVCSIRFSRRIL